MHIALISVWLFLTLHLIHHNGASLQRPEDMLRNLQTFHTYWTNHDARCPLDFNTVMELYRKNGIQNGTGQLSVLLRSQLRKMMVEKYAAMYVDVYKSNTTDGLDALNRRLEVFDSIDVSEQILNAIWGIIIAAIKKQRVSVYSIVDIDRIVSTQSLPYSSRFLAIDYWFADAIAKGYYNLHLIFFIKILKTQSTIAIPHKEMNVLRLRVPSLPVELRRVYIDVGTVKLYNVDKSEYLQMGESVASNDCLSCYKAVTAASTSNRFEFRFVVDGFVSLHLKIVDVIRKDEWYLNIGGESIVFSEPQGRAMYADEYRYGAGNYTTFFSDDKFLCASSDEQSHDVIMKSVLDKSCGWNVLAG